MSRGLVLCAHDAGVFQPQNLRVITAAKNLVDKVDALVVGVDCEQAVHMASSLTEVNKVFWANNKCFQTQMAENITELITSSMSDYQAYIFAGNTSGKNLMPRVAAKLGVSPISDVIEIVDNNTFKRPIYAGNAIATVRSHEKKIVLTVRTTKFTEAKLGNTDKSKIEIIDKVFTNSLSTFIEATTSSSDKPDLCSAKVVVSGGRGVGSKDNFKLIEQFAEKLSAAVGASRAAVDAGYVPNDYQVGQTGKIVAPEVYYAIGISGAIQHLAGMKDSSVIVAINNDEEAPIFEVADYGYVGDLFSILPKVMAVVE